MSFFGELRRRNVFRVAVAYTVTAWLVAQVAELALESFGTPEWVMKTLLLLLALGLPLAIIFAWAFEVTPEGIKRERDVDRSQSITNQTGRKLNYTIIGVLVIALVLSVATRDIEFSMDEPAEQVVTVDESEKSIAVLPFVNMSDDKENEYFSDGISEELLNVLVKVEGLRVASRTSSFSFKGKDTPIPDIADALNVEHVLEGSVRKAGDTVRITAQLIDVKTDSHLWSETYDRELEDIFVIQDEISAHIVDALRVALGAGEVAQDSARPTDNLAAYEDYLKARHFWQRRGGENIQKAIDLFTKATEADPAFARAWSGLGAAHLTMPTYSGELEEQHFPLALKYAERSLELDPSIAEAHAIIADLLRYGLRWSEAEKHYVRAIELEPNNSTLYLWYGEQLTTSGRHAEALETARIAVDLDPFHPATNAILGSALAILGHTDESIEYMNSAWDLGHPGSLYFLIQMQFHSGNTEEALRLVEENREFFDAETDGAYELYVAASLDPRKVDEYLDYIADSPYPLNIWIALDYVRFGRVDEGLQRIIESGADGGDWYLMWDPDLRPLRQHPRFGELVRNSGLDEFWDEIGWPSQCSRDGDKITCN